MTTYATDDQIQQLARRAINDTTREIAATGVALTWDQADDLGEQVLDWMRSRLGLRIETDADEVRCMPAAEVRS